MDSPPAPTSAADVSPAYAIDTVEALDAATREIDQQRAQARLDDVTADHGEVVLQPIEIGKEHDPRFVEPRGCRKDVAAERYGGHGGGGVVARHAAGVGRLPREVERRLEAPVRQHVAPRGQVEFAMAAAIDHLHLQRAAVDIDQDLQHHQAFVEQQANTIGHSVTPNRNAGCERYCVVCADCVMRTSTSASW